MPIAIVYIAAMLLIGAALSGCASTFESTNTVHQRLQVYVGSPIEKFFHVHGLPYASIQMADGMTTYEWRSEPGGTGTNICRVQMIAGKDLRITAIRILWDTIGNWTVSRCAEVIQT